ncbi:cytochrome c family protein [Rhizobium rhizogenes]|jgi:cytochrome c|uniref:Cytochrome C n=3 Tax=Rhizobium/Agrobacterium group TaxID=227290 RepID=A0AB36EUA1_AGRTU|nr:MULTISPECIES: cytochrome c family protein [Rhizobium/Agrobacterium group]AHK01340.1 cytochrome c2 [Agrobacterium tumefaciens LBA4213 (Ach5)]AKC07141.1 cytochrome c2 [Agrobacterium tumefaciens]EHJ97385.1 Cytochrome c2 [Agrobacterium tumefaciens 5A]MDP9560195.1 cytochrome c [Rhizobium nepotum]ADY64376.1 Cytochrome c2 [Agrobacterium tumefaciens]
MRKRMIITAAMLAASAIPAFSEGDVAKGEAAFKRCSACHAIGEGAKNKVGPQLNGIIGRTAGGDPDYNYSNAMKKAGGEGLVWTPEELRDFLSAPKKKIPGNKMALAGISKPEELDNLIAYIESASSKPAE